MPPAVIAGGIAAAGAVGSAAIGASSANKAAKASQQAADTSAAVQRETYAQNKEILSPFVGRGNVAGDYINAFLGLPGQQQAAQAPTASTSNGLPGNNIVTGALGSGFFGDKPQALNQDQIKQMQQTYGQGWYLQYLAGKIKAPPTQTAQQGNVTTTNPAVTQADAQNAFGNYIDNSDYGFQFATGANQVNSGYAGAGTLQSGAAMKALEGFRQDLQSGYRNEYMNALGNQQGVGLSAGSALAGVGQNYANSLGSIYTNNAANQANAALVKGQNIGNAINSVATIGSNIFGAR